ncbi:hypothetical protein [Pedobacter cryoconitis]|uniref:Glycosyltransferase family 1 protein n=1 Tax=Pedobacter cryoconitis TaxID=188932 RepID=A0A7X0MMH4_9SPHI|nr:hypothetical protein [Pedobacter cryoconitis]MBB6502473.1 hypothetical protein [Pedobacter cryoconitis]
MKSSVDQPPKNLLCFSHLRWDFLLQRPQHLLLRFASDINVYFVEDPVFDAKEKPFFSFGTRSETLWKVVPHLMPGLSSDQVTRCMAELIDEFLRDAELSQWTFWYYNPLAQLFVKKHKPKLTVYDCMDEVSGLRHVPQEMSILEKKLLEKADLVFTEGYRLPENLKKMHANIHSFPNSVVQGNSAFSWNENYKAMFRLMQSVVACKNAHLHNFRRRAYVDQQLNIT